MAESEISARHTVRPATLDDSDEIADVSNAEEIEVLGHPIRSADQLRSDLQMPSVNLVRDSMVIMAADRRMAGFGILYDFPPHVAHYVWCGVRPVNYGQGVGMALLQWAEHRAQENMARAPEDARVIVGQEILHANTRAVRFLAARGYSIARHFQRLEMPLDRIPLAADGPAGISMRSYAGETELPAFVEALEDALQDHWGYALMPAGEMLREIAQYSRTSPRYDPSLWCVAVHGNEIVGVAIAEGETAEDLQTGYVSELSVRRPWRRRGIGSALLLKCLGEFRRRGLERAALDVDSESLTGATRIYKRVGFRPVRQVVAMEKELRPGRDLRTQTAGTEVSAV